MNAAVGADERLVVMLEARITEFEKRMRQAENRGTRTYQGLRRTSRGATQQMEQDMVRSTARINQALASTSSKIGLFAKAFAGGLVGGLAASTFAGLKGSIDATVKSVASLGNEARRAGIGVEVFQEWQFVAEQNRIGIDALTDGFKELHIRAGEFFLDGTGAGAAAFKKLGYSAEELKRKLEDPSKLMVEILGRLGKVDQAGRAFLLEEIFGGAGGEQFSALIGQGEDALRATIARAHEAGAVLDAELIAKAEELDRRFSELATTVANFGKRVAVAIADAGVQMTDLRARLDEFFPDEARGRAIVGDETYDVLERTPDMVDENAEALARLDERYAHLAEEADAAGFAMRGAIGMLESWGYDDAAAALGEAARQMDELTANFREGEMTGEAFADQLAGIETAASAAFAELAEGDRVQFQAVTSQLSRLGGVIASVTSLARSLTSALATAAGVAPDQKASQALRDRHAAEAASMESARAMKEAQEGFAAAEQARNAASSEALRIAREMEQVRKRAKDAGVTGLTEADVRQMAEASLAGDAARQAADKTARGGGGGKARAGGKDRLDDFTREVQAIRDRTAALQEEAVVMLAVAASGEDYGDALEFARKKAELLHAAQQAGKAITPELATEIDQLAQAYVTAGLEAEAAAEKLERIKDQSERGKAALESMFGSIIDGSKSARQAVADLLMELAKTQMLNAIMGLPGMSLLSGVVGGLATPAFASGGMHRGGLRIVGERGPELEATGPARIWTADQTRSMLAGRQPAGAPARSDGGKTRIEVALSPDIEARILSQAAQQSVVIAKKASTEVVGAWARREEDRKYLNGRLR